MLHGVWSNESDLFSLQRYFGDDILVISLRGIFTLWTWQYAWYPVDFSTGKPIYDIRDIERGFTEIVTCIDEVHTDYGISYESIFLMWFSQGAIISYYTLYHAPEKIGGIIALSGRILDELSTQSTQSETYLNKRVFIGHGTEDQVIPVGASDIVERFIVWLGIIPMIHLYSAPHTITPDEMHDIVIWLNNHT